MNKITLDNIKEHIDYYHSYSNYITFCCPFHDDTSPSLLVYENGFVCKACMKRGSLDVLYNKITDYRFVQPPKPAYSNATGLWKRWLERFETVENVCNIAHKYLLENPSPYIVKRRKVGSVVQSCYIGFMDSFFTLPVFDKEHKIIGAVARASPTIQTKENRYFNSPGCNTLYVPNWKQVLESDCLFVVFGIFDALGLSICGFPSVTGVAGSSFNGELLDEFRKPIYVIPDLNEEKQALTLISKLDWRGTLLQVEWPEGCKDTAEVREKYDDEKLKELIGRSIDDQRDTINSR